MNKTGSAKVVLAIELVREKGTKVWHRPAPMGGAFCRTHISEPERLMIEAEAWPPADAQLCPLCEHLFEEECDRRMGPIYRLAREAARRHG